MIFMVTAMLASILTTFFMSGTASAPCSSRTVEINITSTADVQNLTDALACVGQGIFVITWHFSLTIDERIEVSDGKTVTVTVAGFPWFRGALGDDNAAGVIIDAGSGTGIFSVSDGSTLHLQNIGFEGGSAEDGGAVAVLSSSALYVFGCTFTRNNASNGGALFASNSSIYVAGSTSFEDNSALYGGAIYADDSDIHIDGSTSFGHNSANGATVEVASSSVSLDEFYVNKLSTLAAPSGGALYANSSVVDIDGDTSFADNFAYVQGGAIYAEESAIRVDGKTTFSNNFAQGATTTVDTGVLNTTLSGAIGGAVFAQVSEINIGGNARFTNNSAGWDGGAIYANESEIGIDGDVSFTNNSAGASGGAVYVVSSNAYLHGNTQFSGNNARVGAGAVFSSSSEVGIDGNTTFTKNVGRYGGAIHALNLSELSIDGNTTFTINVGEYGGAVYVDGSEISIDGNAFFRHNVAVKNGGAVFLDRSSNFTIADSKTLRDDLSGNERGLYSEAGGYASIRSIVFVENYAKGLGGAIMFQNPDQVQVSDVMFKSNRASLGGAVYSLAGDDKQTTFSKCVLEGNMAEDGGAVYLRTGPGVNIFTACVFRNNFAGTSGGAIFHVGRMRVLNSSFVANKAGVEGPALMSVGFLEELSNVSFAENTYFCRVGKYGYIDKSEVNFCRSCFDQVCSRCSTVHEGASVREEVRIDGKPVCEKPPVGATAISSGTTVASLTLGEGYFRTSNQSHAILQCYRRSACQGGKDADQYCASGYTGPYCAVCAKGFAPGLAYSCRECSGDITRSAVGLAVSVGLAVLLFACVLLSYLGHVVHDGAEEGMEIDQSLSKNTLWFCRASMVNMLPVRAIKIVMTVWQIISQFDAIAGGVYPELYQKFVSKLGPINLNLEFFFSYSCLVSSDFYDHLVFATITPLLALVVLAGSYLIGKKRNSGSESAMREVWHKHQAAVLFIAFFIYSPVSYIIFQTFGCDPLDDGETYLRADYRLSCLTARHSWYKVYAFIMVAVYPIGITAAFAALLVWHRRDLVKPDRETMLHLEPFNGVWAAYKPSRYCYEVVECCRRIAFTVIAAFVPNSTAQVSMAFLFAVVYVFISEVLSPFEKGIDTGLYRWGNGIIVASMYVAFLTTIDVDLYTASAQYLLTFSGVLIAANVFMVVTVLIMAVLLAKEMHVSKNTVRVIDRPVRRTHSVSLGDLRLVNEGGVCRERGDALESKECDI